MISCILDNSKSMLAQNSGFSNVLKPCLFFFAPANLTHLCLPDISTIKRKCK